MSIVHYPVRVTGYRLVTGEDFVSLELSGVEPRLQDEASLPPEPVGDVTFRIGAEPAVWFDRRAAAHLTRPLQLASAVLDMLRHESVVYLNGDGSFTTEASAAS